MLTRTLGWLSLPLAAVTLCGLFAGASCSSSGGGTGGGHQGSPGGPVSGAKDTHCGSEVQATSPAACEAGGTGGGGGGTSGAGGAPVEEEAPVLFNAEGDDDDCKYHVKWTSTDIYENTDVTFTLVATNKTDGTPLVGAGPETEVYLDDVHPAPNSHPKTSEKSPGTYEIGPIRFDKPGKWTVRFHLFEECVDLTEDSPHGHVAFFVDVP